MRWCAVLPAEQPAEIVIIQPELLALLVELANMVTEYSEGEWVERQHVLRVLCLDVRLDHPPVDDDSRRSDVERPGIEVQEVAMRARQINRGPGGENLPYLALDETHLARWRGNCLVAFGDPATADELANALAAMDGEFTRAEAGLRCDLAAALHVRGEKEQARAHLKKARDLAQVTGSARQRRRIRDLAGRLGRVA